MSKDSLLIGGYIPPALFAYIDTYSLAKRIGKTEIIVEALLKFEREHPHINTLTKEIADNIQMLWDFTDDLQFKTFIYLVRNDLEKRKLTKEQIEYIMQSIKK